MTFLFDGPTPLDGLDLGTVVHIGAGAGEVLEAYADLRWQRLILVEGDPDSLLDLRACVGTNANIEVLGQAVAPQAGTLGWHRYNLQTLNGPQEASELGAAYPRLKALGMTTLTAVGFESLLKAHAPTAAGPHLLVLDVPGQSAGLLSSVPADLLRRFGWIVLRSRGPALGDDISPADESSQLLEREGFVPIALEAVSPEPLWRLSLLRLDAGAFQLKRLRDELASTGAAREALATRLDRQQTESAVLAQSLADERTKSADLQRRLEQLEHDAEARSAEAGARQADLEARLGARSEELAALEARRVEESLRQDETLSTALADLQRQHQQESRSDAEAAAGQLSKINAVLSETQRALEAEQASRAQAQAELQALRQQAAQADEQAAAKVSELEIALSDARLELRSEQASRAQAQVDLQALQQEAARADEQSAARATKLESALSSQRSDHERAIEELQQRLAKEAADQASVKQKEFAAAMTEMERKLHVERANVARITTELAQARDKARTDGENTGAKLGELTAALSAERAAHAQAVTDLRLQEQKNKLGEETAAGKQADFERAMSALEQKLEADRAAHAKVVADLERNQQQVKTNADAATARESELSTALAAARRELSDLSAAHAKAMTDLQGKVDAMADAARQHQDKLALLAKERQTSDSRFAERIEALEDEAHGARQAAALSVKLQTLREADLKDLQQRYQTTLAQQQGQQELLTKLAQRLTVANQYFHELSHAQQLPKATPAITKAPAPRKRRSRAKTEASTA